MTSVGSPKKAESNRGGITPHVGSTARRGARERILTGRFHFIIISTRLFCFKRNKEERRERMGRRPLRDQHFQNLVKISEGGVVRSVLREGMLSYLVRVCGWSNQATASMRLTKLIRAGLVRVEKSGKQIVAIHLLGGASKETSSHTKDAVGVIAAPPAVVPEAKTEEVLTVDTPTSPGQIRIAILIDWDNLHIGVEPAMLKDFGWLMNPLLQEGCSIVMAMVFYPQTNDKGFAVPVPLQTLSNVYDFMCVCCPRKYAGGSLIKSVDRVDHKMEMWGSFFVQHTDITDIVIVSGDGDFRTLANVALRYRKRVRIIAPKGALAEVFRKLPVGALEV